MAIEAAIQGQGLVLALDSMISGDPARSQLIIPCLRALPMPASYYLTWNRNNFHKAQCRDFQRWLIARGRTSSA